MWLGLLWPRVIGLELTPPKGSPRGQAAGAPTRADGEGLGCLEEEQKPKDEQKEQKKRQSPEEVSWVLSAPGSEHRPLPES